MTLVAIELNKQTRKEVAGSNPAVSITDVKFQRKSFVDSEVGSIPASS